MRGRRPWAVSCAVAAVAMAMSSCGAAQPAGPDTQPVTNTMAAGEAAPSSLPLTGTGSSIGQRLTSPSTVLAISQSTTTTAQTTRVSIADWPQFDTVQALAASSSLVVVAQVLTVHASTQNPGPGGRPAKNNGNGTISTTFTFTVENVIIRHDGPQPGTSLEVTTSGGTVNGLRSIVGGALWYQQGKRYLLFLRWFPGHSAYSDVGGVQAVYPASSQGQLESISDPYLHTPVMDSVNGSTLDQLTKLLQSPHR